jgi:hypothetical protein
MRFVCWAANPHVDTYYLQVSRYLRQLPAPCSPSSSLCMQANRNCSHSPPRCRYSPRPPPSMRTPPGPNSICWEYAETGKKRAAAVAMAKAYLYIERSPYSRVVFPSPQSETRNGKYPKLTTQRRIPGLVSAEFRYCQRCSNRQRCDGSSCSSWSLIMRACRRASRIRRHSNRGPVSHPVTARRSRSRRDPHRETVGLKAFDRDGWHVIANHYPASYPKRKAGADALRLFL